MSKFEPFAIIVNPDELSFCAAASMLIADAWSNPDAAIYLAFKRDGITQISRSTLLERIYGYTDIGVRRIYLVGYCMDTKKYLYHKATTTDLVFINSNYLFEHVSSSIQAKYRKFFQGHAENADGMHQVFKWASSEDFIYWLAHVLFENSSYNFDQDDEAYSIIEDAKEEYAKQEPIYVGYRCNSCGATFKFPATFSDSHGQDDKSLTDNYAGCPYCGEEFSLLQKCVKCDNIFASGEFSSSMCSECDC